MVLIEWFTKKKKKIAGRGCVPLHFQRDNVEVCFTCPETVGGDSDAEFHQQDMGMKIAHGLRALGKEAEGDAFLICKLFTSGCVRDPIAGSQRINITRIKLS